MYLLQFGIQNEKSKTRMRGGSDTGVWSCDQKRSEEQVSAGVGRL